MFYFSSFCTQLNFDKLSICLPVHKTVHIVFRRIVVVVFQTVWRAPELGQDVRGAQTVPGVLAGGVQGAEAVRGAGGGRHLLCLGLRLLRHRLPRLHPHPLLQGALPRRRQPGLHRVHGKETHPHGHQLRLKCPACIYFQDQTFSSKIFQDTCKNNECIVFQDLGSEIWQILAEIVWKFD